MTECCSCCLDLLPVGTNLPLISVNTRPFVNVFFYMLRKEFVMKCFSVEVSQAVRPHKPAPFCYRIIFLLDVNEHKDNISTVFI